MYALRSRHLKTQPKGQLCSCHLCVPGGSRHSSSQGSWASAGSAGFPCTGHRTLGTEHQHRATCGLGGLGRLNWEACSLFSNDQCFHLLSNSAHQAARSAQHGVVGKSPEQGEQDPEPGTACPSLPAFKVFGLKGHFPCPGLVLPFKPWRSGV